MFPSWLNTRASPHSCAHTQTRYFISYPKMYVFQRKSSDLKFSMCFHNRYHVHHFWHICMITFAKQDFFLSLMGMFYRYLIKSQSAGQITFLMFNSNFLLILHFTPNHKCKQHIGTCEKVERSRQIYGAMDICNKI